MKIQYAKLAVKSIETMDRPTKQRIKQAMEDFASEDDREAHHIAMQEYMRGKTVSHDDIDWE